MRLHAANSGLMPQRAMVIVVVAVVAGLLLRFLLKIL